MCAKIRSPKQRGGLAQLGERLHGMQEVTGSSPVFSTIFLAYFPSFTCLAWLLNLQN